MQLAISTDPLFSWRFSKKTYLKELCHDIVSYFFGNVNILYKLKENITNMVRCKRRKTNLLRKSRIRRDHNQAEIGNA